MKKSILTPWVSPINTNTASTISGSSVKESRSSHNLEECHISSKLIACETIAAFKENVANILMRLGWTDFCFTVLNTLPAKSLTTLPPKLHENYLEDCYYLMQVVSSDTPVFLSALDASAAKTSRSLPGRQVQNAVYKKLFAHHGYHDGYCIPIDIGDDHRKAMFTLFIKRASREAFQYRVERYKFLLPMVLGAVAYFGFTKFSDHFLNAKPGKLPPLPPPAVLETMVRDGVRAADAASKWRSSLDAANRHLAAAKHALDATPLTNMVYLAMVQGFKQSGNQDGLQRPRPE